HSRPKVTWPARASSGWPSGVLSAGGLRVHRKGPLGKRPGLNRQLQQEGRSLPLARLDPDVSAHSVHELAADVQTQPGPAHPTRHLRIESIELLEDPGLLVRRDADAFVLDEEDHRLFARRLSRLEPDLDPAAVGRILDRIL